MRILRVATRNAGLNSLNRDSDAFTLYLNDPNNTSGSFPDDLVLRETAPGVTVEEVLSKTDAELIVPDDVKMMDI